MATVTINIPVDKEQWVLDGFASRFNYQAMVDNPDFDKSLPVDAETNPRSIANEESLPAFAKRILIHMIKVEANAGHNQNSQIANDIIANTVTLS